MSKENQNYCGFTFPPGKYEFKVNDSDSAFT